jgi:hypothetical protein
LVGPFLRPTTFGEQCALRRTRSRRRARTGRRPATFPYAMRERTAAVVASILDRPMCSRCISDRSALTAEEVGEILEKIAELLSLTARVGRCRTCWGFKPVFALDRPPAPRPRVTPHRGSDPD